MKTPFKPKFIKSCIGLLGAVLFSLPALPNGLAAPPNPFTDHSATIAIDPGHGGQYTGVRGPTGLTEKSVCLDLAQKLSLQLEPEYQVVLTRSDDYHVDLLQRTAAANQAKADLFISLHTAGSFLHSAQGAAIYYHQSSAPPKKARPSRQEAENGAYQPWRQIQARHSAASQTLANELKTHIEQIPQATPCRIQSAPLTVLQGADMPAVIIEIGHLTHPATEKTLASPQGVERMAAAIKKGVVQFLEQRMHSPQN